jgi:tetratricopeptide (TPR) repeat protein
LTAPPEASPLAGTIVQAIGAGNILEPGGAWELYQRLLGDNPREPQRVSIEAALSTALEEVGQRAINDYVHAPITDLRRDTFHRAARAFAALTALRPGESQLQAKELFFVGRALVVDGKYTQAAATLERAAAADPRAAHVQNALGVAYERLNRNQDALRAFQAAARLAPAWALPHLHLALQYQAQRTPAAEQEFKTAVQLDPRQPLLRVALASFYGAQLRYPDAERELSKVVETSPNYAGAYRELGGVYEATRQYGRAADSLENYLRLAPAAADSADVRGRIAKNRAQAWRKPPTLRR